ncbi:MAG: HPr family phosphocarrier protein [Nitrospinae bacterium]|nr:HPr family phosphocarrier protein [Nitrospinota bacterium]
MTTAIMSGDARQRVTVVNPWGLHARSAMRFVKAALPYSASVTVSCDGLEPVDGKEVMSLLTLGAPCGSVLTITASGADADAAVETLAGLVEDGFGEMRPERDERP